MRHVARTLVLAAALLAGAGLDAQPARAPQPLTVGVANQTAAAEAARGTPRRDTLLHANDVLRYTLTFTNVVGRPVRGVELKNPIPAGLRLVAGTATASRPDAALEFSADGGATWAAQPTETVVENGREVRRPIPADRFTHVRWTVSGAVAPQAAVVASFDARFAVGSAAASTTAPRAGGR